MLARSGIALALTPIVAGGIATIAYLLQSPSFRIGPRDIVQIAAWVLMTLLFECIVLLPIAVRFRHRVNVRLRIFILGSITWVLFAFAWFYTVFGLTLKDAAITSIPMGISGMAICGAFAFLWGRLHA